MAGILAITRVKTAMLGMIAMFALGACGSSSSSSTPTTARASLAPGCRAASAADQTVTTRMHVFLLHIGSPETMLMITAAQAKAKHITSGELMLGGSMAGMSAGGMKGHMTMRHLEIHICDRASGKVVSGVIPAITTAPSSGGAPEHVPVMVMQGVSAGGGDLHYGNNVPLLPGASNTITVRLGADRAVFSYKVPRGM